MLRSISIILLFFCLLTEVNSQRKKDRDTSAFILQTDRIEFRDDKSGTDFTIINGEENGLMVLKEGPTRHSGSYGWEMYKLDTVLNIEWTKLRLIPGGYTFRGWDHSEGNFYLLFASSQYNPEEFSIFEIDGVSGDMEEIKMSTVFPIALTHFEVFDNVVLLGGITSLRPAVLTFDLDERKPRVVPGLYESNSEIVDIYMNDELGVFSIAMIEQLINKRVTVGVKTYTSDNLVIQQNRLDPGERRNLIDGAPTDFSTGFQYIAGAYSPRSKEFSRGLYLGKFMNGRQQFIKFYEYGELENFFDYLNPNRKSRVKEKINKKRAQGKEKRFNYRLKVHDIVQRGREYIMIAEAYYPKYSNYRTMVPYGPYNNSYRSTRNYSNIIGYRYTHAIVVSFDQNGNILWDHSFPIDDVTTQELTELVTVNVLKDKIELLYLEENTIRSKTIQGNEILEGKTYTPIRVGDENEEMIVKDPDVEGLEHWYGETLYAYGEQVIERKVEGRLKNRRDVFYINKVRHNLEQYNN